MRPRAGKEQDQHLLFYPVDQQPVGLNVAFPEPCIVPTQIMVAVFGVEGLSAGKLSDYLIQEIEIIAPFMRQLQILLETVG